MPDTNAKISALRHQLEAVNARIAGHPLQSETFLRARSVAAERTEGDARELNETLRRQGLPTLGAQARMVATGAGSLARLNRRRIRLEKRLAAYGHDTQ
mgnify:CR=1 FL=1